MEPNFEKKSVSRTNKITFSIINNVSNPTFQIDLQQPMEYKILDSDLKISSEKRDGDFIFIQTNQNLKKGETHFLTIQYSGNPTIAKRAPWDGGWIFEKDHNGNPWITAAQEGIGASVWLPIKDIWNDEPDNGIAMKIVTPKDLVGVGNGRLISKATENGKNIFTWEVKNSIND